MSSKTAEKYNLQVKGERKLQFVRLSQMKVNPEAQREFNSAWANKLFSEFDLDKMQTPHVNHRIGSFWIMDGQHTIGALKQYLGNWEEQMVECWVYENLSEEQEAEMFLSLNHKKNVDTFQLFKKAVRAGRQVETEIEKIAVELKLTISKQAVSGSVRAVGTLLTVYRRNGPDALTRSLSVARDAYGDSGLAAPVIDGFGLLCSRYNGVLGEKKTIESLGGIHGGVNGLLGMAEQLRQKTGNSKPQCVAAAAVSVINRGRVGKDKLPSWWKE